MKRGNGQAPQVVVVRLTCAGSLLPLQIGYPLVLAPEQLGVERIELSYLMILRCLATPSTLITQSTRSTLHMVAAIMCLMQDQL